MLNRLLTAVIALGLLFGVACTQQRANTPSVKDQVNKAMDNANLKDVKVDEDRDKGVVTLTGDVATPEDKQRAEEIARQNAPNMVVSNEIGVRPQGAEGTAKDIDKDLDAGIEKNYKAALTENRLDNQHTGHHRKVREMAGEKWLIYADVFDSGNLCLAHVQDPVHKKHGIAMRQQFANFLNIEFGHSEAAIITADGPFPPLRD